MTAPKKTPGANGAGSVLSTVAGPADAAPPSPSKAANPVEKRLFEKSAAEKQLAADMPFNPNKPGEYGDASRTPAEGDHHQPVHTGRHRQHQQRDRRFGQGRQRQAARRAPTRPSRRWTACASTRAASRLTTNQGVPVADNQNSLKAGLRGPTLLEDFILREKITHFDHERIPERVVHARGSARARLLRVPTSASATLTRAAPFAASGKQTPVFVRFSTVAGERGSTDTARDVRGFAVKFYTDEGNWDLVGNNIPVFFIQDAMKFPDLVHAVKPEPHHAMPQAATAHDTFWDFVSLMPESTHMLMWVMSDRAIPRSYRMMQGFGVHTFRLVNAAGRVALREVPLDARCRAPIRWCGTRR